jgi:hypothetical protein
VHEIAISATNRSAVLGAWATFNGNQAYVQVFDP